MRRVPAIGKAVAADQRPYREGNRQVQDKDEALGYRAVVDGGTVLHRDWKLPTDPAIRGDHNIPNLIRLGRVIAKGVEFARRGITVRMRGERALKGSAEIVI